MCAVQSSSSVLGYDISSLRCSVRLHLRFHLHFHLHFASQGATAARARHVTRASLACLGFPAMELLETTTL